MIDLFRKSDPKSDPKSAPGASSVAPSVTILVVDDSPTETRVISNMLIKAGYRVETAVNGEEGIAMAQRLLPDVIIMDVIMPVLNGFQATRMLRRDEATAAIPIIIVTTKDQQTDRTWGLRQGATDYLIKPVDSQTLLASIHQALAAASAPPHD